MANMILFRSAPRSVTRVVNPINSQRSASAIFFHFKRPFFFNGPSDCYFLLSLLLVQIFCNQQPSASPQHHTSTNINPATRIQISNFLQPKSSPGLTPQHGIPGRRGRTRPLVPIGRRRRFQSQTKISLQRYRQHLPETAKLRKRAILRPSCPIISGSGPETTQSDRVSSA